MNNLSIDGEFRYIIQWFNEWSELQREDFIPVIVDYLNKDTGSTVYVNGIVHTVSNVGINDKPMSLFQCRIKLFREWNKKWPTDFKPKLVEKINELDSKVGAKINDEIKQYHNNGTTYLNVNGGSDIDDNINTNGNNVLNNHHNENNDCDNQIDDLVTDNVNNRTNEIIAAAEAIVQATEDAINIDRRLDATIAIAEAARTTTNNISENNIDMLVDDAQNIEIVVSNAVDDVNDEVIDDNTHTEPAEQVQMQTQQEHVSANDFTTVVSTVTATPTIAVTSPSSTTTTIANSNAEVPLLA